jgi:APA family basic amino acid/polyamine antiporter
MNIVIVSITLLALGTFILFGLPTALAEGGRHLVPILPVGVNALQALLYATALMFVAYTGYARIATLGEEVKEPKRTIPRAIIVTLIVTAALYIVVAVVAVGGVGADQFANAPGAQATPLELAARTMELPMVAGIVAVGAVTAMLGVLLNLIIGLSRVVLAMGRQGDLPPLFARLSRDGAAPAAAVIVVGGIVAGLAAIGSVETTWAFSAFTVLIYYAITNLAALRLPPDQRMFPRFVPVVGLLACLFLAFWVPVAIWALGLGLIAAGLVFRISVPRLWNRKEDR